MFGYEMQQARQAEFQHRADEWRLARDVRAARTAARRARRTGRRAVRAAVRTDAEGVPSPGPARRPLGRVHRAFRPHGAA